MVGLVTSTESAIPSHRLRRLLDVLGCARVRNKNIGSAKKDKLPIALLSVAANNQKHAKYQNRGRN
jgi:hypothetical protein